MPEDPATVWGCLAPGPRPPQHPPPRPLPGWPQNCQLHLAFLQGKEGAGAPWPLALTPQGPRALTVKEKKGATVGASHGPSCRRGSSRWGRAVSVAELGSCASFPKARLAFIQGGGEQPRAQGPPRNWRGSWKPTGKWSENTDPGAPHARAHTHIKAQPALWVSALSGPCVKRLADPRG